MNVAMSNGFSFCVMRYRYGLKVLFSMIEIRVVSN